MPICWVSTCQGLKFVTNFVFYHKICFQLTTVTLTKWFYFVLFMNFLWKEIFALLVTGQIFSTSQTALPIPQLAGIQQQLEHSWVKGCQPCETRGDRGNNNVVCRAVANSNYRVFIFHWEIICGQQDGYLMRTNTLCTDCWVTIVCGALILPALPNGAFSHHELDRCSWFFRCNENLYSSISVLACFCGTNGHSSTMARHKKFWLSRFVRHGRTWSCRV